MTEGFTEDQVWDHFFKKLITDDSGNIDIVKLKEELVGYYYLLNQTSFVYSAITGGKIVSANHSASEILEYSVQFFNQMADILRADDKKLIDELRRENVKLMEQLVQ